MPVGLWPSTVLMVIVWLYMAVSGLLVAEANLSVRQQAGREASGLLATIAYLLGKGGAIAAAILYLFIHYALLVAYTARGGDILAAATAYCISQTVPLWFGHVLFSVALWALLFFGKESFIGRFNSILLLCVLTAFCSLVTLTVREIDFSATAFLMPTFSVPAFSVPTFSVPTFSVPTFSVPTEINWEALGTVVPVMFVAFVYHNVVPVVVARLECDTTKIRWAIFLGSLVPLILFLVWNAVILLSVGEIAGDPIERLQSGVNGSQLGTVVSVFSELAVATSFIGFVYGLLGFFEDLLPQEMSMGEYARPAKFALVFIPPLLLSVLSPTIFFDAIEVAGAFGVSILFGILPAVMVWKARYGYERRLLNEPLVLGEKAALVVMAVGAIAVIVEHMLQLLVR